MCSVVVVARRGAQCVRGASIVKIILCVYRMSQGDGRIERQDDFKRLENDFGRRTAKADVVFRRDEEPRKTFSQNSGSLVGYGAGSTCLRRDDFCVRSGEASFPGVREVL